MVVPISLHKFQSPLTMTLRLDAGLEPSTMTIDLCQLVMTFRLTFRQSRVDLESTFRTRSMVRRKARKNFAVMHTSKINTIVRVDIPKKETEEEKKMVTEGGERRRCLITLAVGSCQTGRCRNKVLVPAQTEQVRAA